MRRTLVAAIVFAALVAGPGAVAAAAASSPSPSNARLQGQFQMAGVVTSASGVHGVHVGDKVTRTWTFTPACPVGACSAIKLVRARGHGTDRLTLKRQGAGMYAGTGSFYAPLDCGGRVYARGWLVPFKIKVRITAASLVGGVVVATRLTASFVNGSRKNETPCVTAPAHDAARYRGKLL